MVVGIRIVFGRIFMSFGFLVLLSFIVTGKVLIVSRFDRMFVGRIHRMLEGCRYKKSLIF